jgi:PHD/YefM family antitoxin component YafN of YafNO toxin-antitoxin module
MTRNNAMNNLTVTQLRANLYRVIDQVLDTGIPIQIERRGKILKIVPEKSKSKFDNLEAHPGTIVGNREDIVNIDWSQH